jgi:hypothetical protein
MGAGETRFLGKTGELADRRQEPGHCQRVHILQPQLVQKSTLIPTHLPFARIKSFGLIWSAALREFRGIAFQAVFACCDIPYGRVIPRSCGNLG